jgi:hypothetical protein
MVRGNGTSGRFRKELSMKKSMLFLSVMGAALLQIQSVQLFAQGNSDKDELPVAGIHWARGEQPKDAGKNSGSSPNLIWHGGPVMNTVQVTPIFWGSSWGNGNFTADKMTGLASFYSGLGGSKYGSTNNEFDGATSQNPLQVQFNPSVLDLSPAPNNGNRTSPIIAEVCKQIQNPVANGYYPVYVDSPRGHAGYCAWHSTGSCGNTPVQFAFFFNLDGDAGCDPEDTSGHHSQGLAALANVSGHELSETVTDPRLNAWYDSSGAENADKCAWSFNNEYLTFPNNSQWKIQGNWSNNAYNNGSGYPNRSGQKGCIDGGAGK